MTPPLRIGIDARELLGATTGVGRYLGELMRRWVGAPDVRFILYAPHPLEMTLAGVEQRIGGRGTGTLWEQTWLRWTVKRDHPDVFFAPAYTAPLGIGAPVAVTIHDISFVAHPEWFRIREGARRRWLTRRTAETAAVIFTPSRFSRDEIRRYLHVDPRRIEVIPQGLTPRVRGAAETKAGGASEDRFVLYVGSIFNRRHVPELIAAFARATAGLPRTRLVVVGDNRTWPPQDLKMVARQEGVEDRTEFRDYVADDELAALYARATAFAFLSEYEGFGFTPLEAIAAGVPAVLLDTPVAREICGGAAAYVKPGDIDGAAAALRGFLTRADAGAELLRHAPEVLSRYSWDRTAARTLAILQEAGHR